MLIFCFFLHSWSGKEIWTPCGTFFSYSQRWRLKRVCGSHQTFIIILFLELLLNITKHPWIKSFLLAVPTVVFRELYYFGCLHVNIPANKSLFSGQCAGGEPPNENSTGNDFTNIFYFNNRCWIPAARGTICPRAGWLCMFLGLSQL